MTGSCPQRPSAQQSKGGAKLGTGHVEIEIIERQGQRNASARRANADAPIPPPPAKRKCIPACAPSSLHGWTFGTLPYADGALDLSEFAQRHQQHRPTSSPHGLTFGTLPSADGALDLSEFARRHQRRRPPSTDGPVDGTALAHGGTATTGQNDADSVAEKEKENEPPTDNSLAAAKHNPAKKKKYDDRRELRNTISAQKESKRKQREREEERQRKEQQRRKERDRKNEAALEEAARAKAEEDASSGPGDDASLDDSAASSSLSTDDGTNAKGAARKGSVPKPASHEGVPLPMQEELRQKVEQAMQQPGNILQWAKVPWPKWLCELRDADPGDVLRRFAMEQPEYDELLRMLERGRNLVAPDSLTHKLSHICIFVNLNFCSNKRKESWEDRLLSQREDGTLVEPCLQAVFDFLVDILVVGHGVPRENAEFLIRECTAFMDRTLETGDYDWCNKDMASYRARVKQTDGPTRKLARKCAEQFSPAGVYVFSLGEHSHNAVILGENQSEGPWFKGMMNVLILQTSSWCHPVVWLKKWSNEQQRDTVVDGGSLVVASAMGADPPQLTSGDRAQIIEAMSRESERRRKLAEKKTKAKNLGHMIWVNACCLRPDADGNVCGCITEASLESFDRPAGKKPGTNYKRDLPCHGCPGNDSRGCLGYPDGNGGYKKGNNAQHRRWKVQTVLEVLKCCKGDDSAKKRLAEFGHGGCICAECEEERRRQATLRLFLR